MLKTLHIRNYTLIDEITIEFAPGLNILTGETGAGKSILIDALGLVLGERASSDLIREGAEKCIVEGIFSADDNEKARQFIIDAGYESNEDIIVRREITARGGSRAFINDSPAQLSIIKELGNQLVDLHGQHEHQLLLNPDTHITLLDSVGGLEALHFDYLKAYNEFTDLIYQFHIHLKRSNELHEKLDYYQFQIKEIEKVNPREDEDQQILQELKILENRERLFELITDSLSLLTQNENSIRDQLSDLKNHLDQLHQIDESFSEYLAECTATISFIEETSTSLKKYSGNLEFSPSYLEQLRERQATLNGLRKKFGGSIESTLNYLYSIKQEVLTAEQSEEQIIDYQKSITIAKGKLAKLAGNLSDARKEIAINVEKSVERSLKQLGINNARFHIAIAHLHANAENSKSITVNGENIEFTNAGIDNVEFYISTNTGESLKPLAKTASGGEISRIMLALKTILAKKDKLPLLIFDEIDTGISGRIASKVGVAMKELSQFHQIIAITHLPQIAAMSENHFIVEKQVLKNRTKTSVRKLDREEHIHEVAKLFSGEDITESSIRMARELIKIDA